MNNEQPSTKTPTAPSSRGWTDTAISSQDDDQFGFRDYAEVLARRIIQADTPLTIGVYGRWGSGKTSLMRLIEAELGNVKQAETLWINVWKLSNREELWNAFLQALLTQVHESLGRFPRLKFDWSLFKERVRWGTLWRMLLVNSYRIVITVTPILLVILAPTEAKAGTTQFLIGSLNPIIGTGVSLILGLWLLLRPAVEAAKEKVSLDLETVLKDAPYEAQVSALQQLEKQFERMVKAWVGDKGRLVIFIDDLDRCTPDKVPDVLEAIKLFTTTRRCVYVIGLDNEIVRQGIAIKYKFEVREAAEYLEKIVQIPFYLPPLDTNRIEIFLREYYQELKDVCPFAPDVFAAGLEPNPRRIKRALNIYRTLLDLADVRVRAWEMDPVDPELVAKMVVIESRFRALHQYLVTSPVFLLVVEKEALDDNLDPEVLQNDEVGRILFDSDPKLVEENDLEALSDMLRAGKKRFNDDDQKDQIRSYIYLIATAEGGSEQIRPNREDQADLLSGDRERVRARVEEILQRGGDDESARQRIGQIYIERLEQVSADSFRYTAEEEASSGFALSLLEVALLGETPESIQARLHTLLPPQVEIQMQQQSLVESTTQQIMGMQKTREQAIRRLQNILADVTSFDSTQVVAANLALDVWEGWERQEFEPQTLRVPAGPFLMGFTNDDKDAQQNEKPQHTVELEAYRIGRYLVTNAEYYAFVQQAEHPPPEHWKSGDYPPEKADHPVVYVSWHDAVAYCQWLSEQTDRTYRLPTEAEWEKAARGTDGRIYPWGNEFDQNKCNSSGAGLGDTTSAGQYSPEGDSPYGAADMAGNVWEWCSTIGGKPYSFQVEDEWSSDYLERTDVRVLRGGAFYGYGVNVRSAFRLGNYPYNWYIYNGFRVVLAPIGSES